MQRKNGFFAVLNINFRYFMTTIDKQKVSIASIFHPPRRDTRKARLITQRYIPKRAPEKDLRSKDFSGKRKSRL